MRNAGKKITGILLVTVIVIVAVFWYHGVSKQITKQDEEFIPLYTQNIEAATVESEYEAQIEFIKRVQNSVLNVAPLDSGLPYRQQREPKDLYEAKKGLCFDRSRVIEKILQYHGFQTRHIFIYSTKNSNALKAFATPQVPSHAVTEVWTKKGWLVIDSNDEWISLEKEGNPVSIENMSENLNRDWASPPPEIYKTLAPYTFVYGLYSRHGEFYPPYNFIPDVNYGEFLDNFWSN